MDPRTTKKKLVFGASSEASESSESSAQMVSMNAKRIIAQFITMDADWTCVL